MCGLTAQHHALSYGNLHPVWAQLHTHGICKHKVAAVLPQANPGLAAMVLNLTGSHMKEQKWKPI